MADFFLATNVGLSDNQQALSVGVATQSKDLELHILTTNNPTKKDVIKFLRTLEIFILSNGLGTATGVGVDLPPI